MTAMDEGYSLPQLRELLRMSLALGFMDDVRHWRDKIREAEKRERQAAKRPCDQCGGQGFGVQSKDPDIEWYCPECQGTGTCRGCALPGVHPPHDPSPRCQHNGTITHCTCAACW